MAKTNTPYMKLRHHVWGFRYSIPKDLQPHFGGKREITKTLGRDRKVAQDRAYQLAALAF